MYVYIYTSDPRGPEIVSPCQNFQSFGLLLGPPGRFLVLRGDFQSMMYFSGCPVCLGNDNKTRVSTKKNAQHADSMANVIPWGCAKSKKYFEKYVFNFKQPAAQTSQLFCGTPGATIPHKKKGCWDAAHQQSTPISLSHTNLIWNKSLCILPAFPNGHEVKVDCSVNRLFGGNTAR